MCHNVIFIVGQTLAHEDSKLTRAVRFEEGSMASCRPKP